MSCWSWETRYVPLFCWTKLWIKQQGCTVRLLIRASLTPATLNHIFIHWDDGLASYSVSLFSLPSAFAAAAFVPIFCPSLSSLSSMSSGGGVHLFPDATAAAAATFFPTINHRACAPCFAGCACFQFLARPPPGRKEGRSKYSPVRLMSSYWKKYPYERNDCAEGCVNSTPPIS